MSLLLTSLAVCSHTSHVVPCDGVKEHRKLLISFCLVNKSQSHAALTHVFVGCSTLGVFVFANVFVHSFGDSERHPILSSYLTMLTILSTVTYATVCVVPNVL